MKDPLGELSPSTTRSGLVYTRGLRRMSQGCRRSHGARKGLHREHQLDSQAGGPLGPEAENPPLGGGFSARIESRV